MNREIKVELQSIELLLQSINPVLASKLQEGLPAEHIHLMLKKARISGDIEALVELYTWKNGTVLDREVARLRQGFLPQERFHFVELERAIADYSFFSLGAKRFSNLANIAGRVLPCFWNGSTEWVSVAITPDSHNALFHIDSLYNVRMVSPNIVEFLKQISTSYQNGEPVFSRGL